MCEALPPTHAKQKWNSNARYACGRIPDRGLSVKIVDFLLKCWVLGHAVFQSVFLLHFLLILNFLFSGAIFRSE